MRRNSRASNKRPASSRASSKRPASSRASSNRLTGTEQAAAASQSPQCTLQAGARRIAHHNVSARANGADHQALWLSTGSSSGRAHCSNTFGKSSHCSLPKQCRSATTGDARQRQHYRRAAFRQPQKHPQLHSEQQPASAALTATALLPGRTASSPATSATSAALLSL